VASPLIGQVTSQVARSELRLILTVIIVNWNVRDLLRDCLHSLHQQMLLPPSEWELIVVDNNSNDESAAMVQTDFAGAILLANKENLGFGNANNQAFAISRGKYLLLLNPDTVVVEHAVDRMLEIIQGHPDIGALGCCLLNADGSFQRWTGGSAPNLRNVAFHFLLGYKFFPASILPRPIYLEHEPTHDVQVGWVSGACMLLRREALGESIFDKSFFLYGEDLDLCERLIRNGWKVLYTPRARIFHLEGRSLQGQSKEIQVSKVRAMRKIFARRHTRVAVLVYDLLVTVGFFLRTVLFGLAARMRPGRGYQVRNKQSRQYFMESLRALVGR
jgi:N-acetylglucosaminyl-diphospho-decaprenol L-rhamnosyltransferase